MANNADDDGRDPVVVARWRAMSAYFSSRRTATAAVVASLVVAALLGRDIPWQLLAIVVAFGVSTEVEKVLAGRVHSLRSFEEAVLAIRLVQMPLLAAGLHVLMGPLVVPLALALGLVGASGLLSGRRVAIMALTASLANLLMPAAVDASGLSAHVFARSTSEHYDLFARVIISVVGLPAIAAFLHRRARGLMEVHEALAQTVRELRLAQRELGASQTQLERWNQELNDEVARKTSALGERNRYLTIINAISFALSEPMDDMGTLTRAIRLVARLLRARAAQASHRVTESREITRLFVTVADDDLQAPRLPEALMRTVAESGRSITSEDGAWTENLALPDLGEPYVVVPLVAKGRTLGAFALIGTGEFQWGEQERHLLLLIGREMGVALENARLYREALARARREQLLAECSRMLQEGTGPRGIAQAIQLVADHLGTRDLALVRLTGRRKPSVETHVIGARGSTRWLRPLVRSLPALSQDRTEALVLGDGGEAPLSDAIAAEGIGTLAVSPIVAVRRVVEATLGEPGPARQVTRRDCLGVLVATLSYGNRWDETTSHLVHRISEMLAQRIETDQLTALQQRRIAELGALANVARVMQSTSDVDRLCAGFAEALSSLLPYRQLRLARLSEFGDLVSVPVFSSGGRPAGGAPFTADDRRHAWFSLRAHRAWRPDDGPTPSFLQGAEGALLVVPMRPKGQIRGAAVIVTDEPVGSDQATIVEQAVEQLALALDNATLYHQATARASHIQTLSNLARIVASVVDLREAFAAFAEEVRWLIPFERSVMLLIDEEAGVVEPYAIYPAGEVLSAPVPIGDSVVSAVVEGGSAVALTRSDPRYAELDWSVFGPGGAEVAAVPVRQGPRTAAVFAVMHHAEGSYAALDLNGLDEVAGLLGVTIERLRLYERAEYGARHDPLTDLPNYRYLQERLADLHLGITEPGESAVLQLDMDNLKPINDTLGHEAGDRLIQAVARRLLDACGERHFVARSGGDEFTMVMEGAGTAEAAQMAEALHAAMRDAHLDVPGAPVRVGVSIGIAIAPHDGATTAELMHAADLAMYEAKFGGGTRTRLANDRSAASAPVGKSRRSHRIAETLVRSIVNGATPDERTTLAVAQRWTAAAMIGAGLDDDLISIARMLVALEALPRVTHGPSDNEQQMAEFFIGNLRDDWRERGDALRRALSRSIVPAAVDLAWRREADANGPYARIDFSAEAQRWDADPDSEIWIQFLNAIRSDDREQHARSAA